MEQKYYVIEAMEKNGGYATFQQLNRLIDFSSWGTKTPQASVRRIVQTNEQFFRIEAGLWGLSSQKKEILKKLNIVENEKESKDFFAHSYIQGIISALGNMRNFQTYVPPQDKNHLFLETKLSDITTVDTIFNFSYPSIVKFAKTIDVIWFNGRALPNSFYEVEHTTDIKNSLNKFYELQDFRAKFYIVAPKSRERQFDDIIDRSIYREIKNLVKFVDYESIIKQYEKESIVVTEVI